MSTQCAMFLSDLVLLFTIWFTHGACLLFVLDYSSSSGKSIVRNTNPRGNIF